MKIQIARLSPHQNGKVFGILSAIISAVFILPFMLLAMLFAPKGQGGFSFILLILMPLFYLVVSYLMMVVFCWLYNMMFGSIGGIEFEAKDSASTDALR
jgi:hypothetical protein